MLPYDTALNARQREAVLAGGGATLVLAGAGTGKTRVLTWRVARLLELGVEPAAICLLTFTNRAADEMLTRVRDFGLGDPDHHDALWGGTFHSVAHRMLRQHAHLLGYPDDYLILDPEDARRLMADAILEADPARRATPSAAALLDLCSRCINTDDSLEELLALQAPALLPHAPVLRDVLVRYMARKIALGVMDFDDLLINMRRLLMAHDEVRTAFTARFEHVLVDEFQDASPLQCAVVDLLASHHGNLMAVGDDCQSIYGFRGVDPAHIRHFTARYPRARIIHLDTNYRSTPQILAVASSSIRHTPDHHDKTLQAPLATSSGPRPAMVQCLDADAQAHFVAEWLHERRTASGRPWSDHAVLYRAHWHARALEVVLSTQGIPFVQRSGARFFEQAHIKDLLGVVRLATRPHDRIALDRCIGRLRGAGPRSAARVAAVVEAAVDDPRAALCSERAARLLPRAAQNPWRALAAVIREVAQQIEAHPDRLGVALEMAAQPVRGWILDRHGDTAARRLDDLTTLIAWADTFEHVDTLLDQVGLMAEARRLHVGESGTEGAVQLCSIHQAKGLEWPVVCVIGLADELFPGTQARTREELDEERRLFHVAVTRAQHTLALTWPSRITDERGLWSWARRSCFLDEL
ncbi:MAG: ATP-dependent helicase, partial [Myxococcota bacterium]